MDAGRSHGDGETPSNKSAGPIGVVDLEAVAEHRVDRPGSAAAQQAIAGLPEMRRDRRTIVVIEHVAVGTRPPRFTT